jgi:hypothetical protein
VEEEWVGPVELLAALEGDEGSKRDAVERRIRGKQMALKADAVLINGEPSGHIVPIQLWTNGGSREADWLRGDFVSHGSADTWIRYEAFGVRFSKADAERMGAEFGREDADDTRAIVAEVAQGRDAGLRLPNAPALLSSKRQCARPGPKSACESKLKEVFSRLHDRLVEASQRERHRIVGLHITDHAERPKSATTTEQHWKRHLERRAAESR